MPRSGGPGYQGYELSEHYNNNANLILTEFALVRMFSLFRMVEFARYCLR